MSEQFSLVEATLTVAADVQRHRNDPIPLIKRV